MVEKGRRNQKERIFNMKKGEFINVSKRMVKEYFNIYVAGKDGIETITLRDICVVGFSHIDGNYKILLSTPISDGVYYKVTYNKDSDELYSSFVKTENKRYFRKDVKIIR